MLGVTEGVLIFLIFKSTLFSKAIIGKNPNDQFMALEIRIVGLGIGLKVFLKDSDVISAMISAMLHQDKPGVSVENRVWRRPR